MGKHCCAAKNSTKNTSVTLPHVYVRYTPIARLAANKPSPNTRAENTVAELDGAPPPKIWPQTLSGLLLWHTFVTPKPIMTRFSSRGPIARKRVRVSKRLSPK